MSQTEKTPSADQNHPNDISRPGVMGDWTEEQNLGQPGNPAARITEEEVEEAFGQDGGNGQDGGKEQGSSAPRTGSA